jgi:hypothetical protein
MMTPQSKDEQPELIPKSELTHRVFNRISEIMGKK